MIVGNGVNNWLHTKRAMKPPKRTLRFAQVREVGKVRQVRQVRHSATFPVQGARSEGVAPEQPTVVLHTLETEPSSR